MLARLADNLILSPSTRPMDVGGKTRRVAEFERGELELFFEQTGNGEPELFVLKFPGAGGRGERSSIHPAEAWPGVNAEVAMLNYPGFGKSTGKASLRMLPEASFAAYRDVARRADGRPIILTGNSLGVVCALYVAARERCDGLVLRNGPPLKEVILGRFGWWNFDVAAGWVAQQVPDELCAMNNAEKVSANAVFVMSCKDRIVPAKYQRPMHEAYAGESQVIELKNAGHADPGDEPEQRLYLSALQWLLEGVMESSNS